MSPCLPRSCGASGGFFETSRRGCRLKEWRGRWRLRRPSLWRAIVSGRKGEYAGTWNASVELKPTSPFADLFELAVKNIVSGNWQAGGHAGAWSIRAYER